MALPTYRSESCKHGAVQAVQEAKYLLNKSVPTVNGCQKVKFVCMNDIQDIGSAATKLTYAILES